MNASRKPPSCLAPALSALGGLRRSGTACFQRFLGRTLFPFSCAACGVVLHEESFLCAECAEESRPYSGPRCPQCARPCPALDAGNGNGPPAAEGARSVTRCGDCRVLDPAYECVIAPMRSTGVVREVLHRFKYEGRRYLLPLLEGWILQGSEDPRLRDPPVEVWVPVPLHWGRRWWRGFNQAELLARAVARVRGGECVEALRRERSTGTQTRLERSARLQNVRGAIRLLAGMEARVRGRSVGLVDDVLTTGATADACARALREAGVREIRVLTVARG